ncbi:DUF3179 domain-containing protein [Salinirubellus sp. GCM10025818]|uniref:DUF3179 domain-containing protein n=1 Tax=Salinirubellus TaxID=2162630 RepID=UPI0030CCF07C
MRRRRYLVGVGTGGLAGLAGCTSFGSPEGGSGEGSGDPGGSRGTPSETNPTGTPGETRRTVNGVEVPIPRSELRRGAGKDAIPAIVDPVFGEDWSGFDTEIRSDYPDSGTSKPRLADDDEVIAVERGGEARAYPLKVLNWHEVVNDTFEPRSDASGTQSDDGSGGPLLVTYCPLCASGVTAVRTVDGEATTFGVSGLLFRNALVMYDEATRSLWSQIAAAAIRGERVGSALELVPSAITTWGEFRAQYPEGVVLRPPPESNTVTGRDSTRDYDRDPYAGYGSSEQIGLGGSYDDDRLHPKTMVVGIEHGGVSRAYPLGPVEEAGVVNDEVGGLPVVVAATDSGTLVAYVREVDGETLAFERESEAFLAAGGSRWRVLSGRAVDGPHEGTRLGPANTVSGEFFFSWVNFHPGTEVWSAE